MTVTGCTELIYELACVCCVYVTCCVLVGSDLESVIEEIRKDVVGRRCRVNITEVEKLALALSQFSRSLACLKGLALTFPVI